MIVMPCTCFVITTPSYLIVFTFTFPCPTSMSLSLSTSTSLMHVSIFTYMYLCQCLHMFKLDFWRGSILFHGTFNMHDFILLCLHLFPTISSFHLLRAHWKQKCRSGRAEYHGWVARRLLQIITWHWLIMSMLKCQVLPEASIATKKTMHIVVGIFAKQNLQWVL